jgi:alkylation response protein AidB-like acyl-CoA dehydrogenase
MPLALLRVVAPGVDGTAAGATDWAERAQRFARDRLRPARPAMDREERISDPIRAELGDAGFLGLTAPREFGGAGATAVDIVGVLSALAKESAAVATLVSVHLSVATAPIAEWGSAGQKAEYLPRLARGEWLGAFALTEPGAGSDAAGIQTRYRTTPTGYRLDGSKMFITNGGLAEVVLTFATHDPALGGRGTTAFLLRKGTKGFSVAHRLAKLGLDASETTELVYDGLELPAEARLGPEGAGLKVALKALTDGRVGIAACALGVAEAALEELVGSVRAAPSDGGRRAAARAYAEVLAARALVERAARCKDEGRPFVEEASAAKLAASQAAVRTAHAAVDSAGYAGVLAGARAGELLRDARVFPIVEGTTEIQELILGRALVGR